MAGADQIVRILALASALSKTRTGIEVKTYAAERGFAARNVYRDLKTLEKAGYPIVEEHSHYKLMDDWEPPCQTGIDRDEALALLLAKELFGSLEGIGFGNALQRLWTKLGTSIESPSFAIRPLSAIDYAPHSHTIKTLKQAIAEQRVARITYQRPDLSQATERLVEAGELYLDPGLEILSLIAWCRLRQEVRVFAVHRIQSISLLDETYQPRPEASSKEKLQSAFRAWSGNTIQQVKLRFAPCIAREIEERTWHKSQTLKRLPDNSQGDWCGTPENSTEGAKHPRSAKQGALKTDANSFGTGFLQLTLQISEPSELIRWLLGLAPHVRILEPAWLAEEVRQRHIAALAESGTEQTSSNDPSKKKSNPEKPH